MALENCRADVEKAIGRKLEPDEAAAIQRRAIGFTRQLERAHGDPAATQAIMDRVAQRGASVLARAKRDRALMEVSRQNFGKARTIAFAADNPGAWLRSFLRGSPFDFFGGKNSLAVDVKHETNQRIGALQAELSAKNISDVADARDPHTQTAINEATHMLRNGSSVQQAAAKWGKPAADVADTFERHREALRTDLNAHGAWISKNSDRTLRRTHDPNKIAKAGGAQYGSNNAKDFWVNEQVRRMDWTRAFDGEFDGATVKERTDLMRKEFDNHISGHVDFLSEYGQGGARGRIGQRFSYQRKYVFNSPADDLAYHQQYGIGTTLKENIEREMSSGGKVLAIMRRLGPRPEETLRKSVGDWVHDLSDTEPLKAKALAETLDNELGNTWKLLTGQNGTPADNAVNRIWAATRHVIGIAKTGMSVFALPNDMALASAQLARYSAGGYRRSVTAQIAELYKAVAHLSKGDRQWVLSQIGSLWENSSRMDPDALDHPGVGAIYNAAGAVARTYGHSLWDNAHRVANGKFYGNIFARDMAHGYGDVALQEGLKRFGIDSAQWDVIRKAKTQMLGGAPVLMYDHIRAIPLDEFKSLTGSKAPSDAMLKRTRDEVAARYRNMLGEAADRSTVATSLENQAALHLGTINQNSKVAEAVRTMLQLKGWGINYVLKHLDQELRGNYANYTTVGHAMRDMMIGRNNKGLYGMSRMIAKGMAIAYVTNSLKQLAMGEKPANPFDFDEKKHGSFLATPGARAAVMAFARQGLGLYSDWAMQTLQATPASSGQGPDVLKDVLGGILGPMGEEAGDLGDVGAQLWKQLNSKHGVTKKGAQSDERKVMEVGWRSIPGTEAWYSKAAFDSLVHDRMSEALNPGYKHRLAKRMRDQGTPLWRPQVQ